MIGNVKYKGILFENCEINQSMFGKKVIISGVTEISDDICLLIKLAIPNTRGILQIEHQESKYATVKDIYMDFDETNATYKISFNVIENYCFARETINPIKTLLIPNKPILGYCMEARKQ